MWQVDAGGHLPTEVHPIDDLRPHVLVEDGGSCWCGAQEDDDGVIVHRALDGRETYEDTRLMG
jgi:hypothetical protein